MSNGVYLDKCIIPQPKNVINFNRMDAPKHGASFVVSGTWQNYVSLVIGIVRYAVRDLRRGDTEAMTFLMSDYCEDLLGLVGIERDYWHCVRARLFREVSCE